MLKLKPIRDENGIAIDFEIEGDFPKYGNDDDRVDGGSKVVSTFMNKIRKHPAISSIRSYYELVNN